MESTKNEEKQEKSDTPDAAVRRRGSIELQKLESRPTIPQRTTSTSEKEVTEKDRANSYPPRPEIIYPPAKTTNYMTCIKYALFGFNLVIWVLGLVILGVSIWLIVDPDFWTLKFNLKMNEFSTAAYIAIVVGLFILFMGFLGCCGAIKENMCLLLTYFIIAIILVFLEAAAMGIVWHATNNPDFQEKLKERVRNGLSHREEDGEAQYFIDVLQSKLGCCGIVSSAEYDFRTPNSCNNLATGLPYEEGCLDKLLTYLRSKASLIGGVAISILLLQMATIAFAICLICSLRQAKQSIF